VLLDAVLDADHARFVDMAHGAHASPFHFSREVSRLSGEPPATMRRRVLLERAAWRLRGGSSVTDAACEAGYDSVDGFSRAFSRAYGVPPSRAGGTGHRLPAPNGIHFHPPLSLWVDARSGRSPRAGSSLGEVALLMVHQDVDDVRALLAAAATADPAELTREVTPGGVPLSHGGHDDDTVLGLLAGLVHAKEQWLAAIRGDDVVAERPEQDVAGLVERHEQVAARWLATVAEIEHRDGWGDRLVDALCDPPESFVLGGVLAHVLTFSAGRRLLARRLLREAGVLPVPTTPAADDADPLVRLAHHDGDISWR
jgi:AraC family transcriptional regulator